LLYFIFAKFLFLPGGQSDQHSSKRINRILGGVFWLNPWLPVYLSGQICPSLFI